METPALNKKGQSLIEVVVALGILTIVFTGVLTLISQVVGLELAARNNTHAVALAQRKLATVITEIGDGCNIGSLSSPAGTETIGAVDFEYQIDINNNNTGFNYTSGLDDSNFTQIVVTISWADRSFSDNSYNLKQIIKK